MAKKFVRGITDIKTINNQDFDTNNVNDLLSDGEHNYIHRKKGTSEEYHNLTDNLKTVSSDNTDLLTVTNDNDTTNSATLHPKPDANKEQSIESTRKTITIEHGTNATAEKTKVDTNPQIVLEHNNLATDYGIRKNRNGNVSQLSIEYSRVQDNYDLDNLTNGRVRAGKFLNAPIQNTWLFVSAFSEGDYTIQDAIVLTSDIHNTTFRRLRANGVWGEWREQVGDKSQIYTLLAQKQNTITNNVSIGVSGTGLQQLYALKQTYNATGGVLKTHVKSVSQNNDINTAEEEFNFIVKLNKGVSSVSFTLNAHDTTKFSNIMSEYGENNTTRISGCVFTLSGSTLTVTTTNNTEQNYVITFSDII